MDDTNIMDDTSKRSQQVAERTAGLMRALNEHALMCEFFDNLARGTRFLMLDGETIWHDCNSRRFIVSRSVLTVSQGTVTQYLVGGKWVGRARFERARGAGYDTALKAYVALTAARRADVEVNDAAL